MKLSSSDKAKNQLVLAAIRLFAETGVDSVSLRMINRQAGSRNNSSMHYHFGGKLGLVEAVDEFIQAEFDVRREPGLLALEQRSAVKPVTVPAVLEVFVEPYIRIIEEVEWGYAAVRTIARMEFDTNEDVHVLLNKSAGAPLRRFSKLLRQAVPELPLRLFNLRLNYTMTSIIQGFADYRNLNHSYYGDLAVDTLEELGQLYVTSGTAIMLARDSTRAAK